MARENAIEKANSPSGFSESKRTVSGKPKRSTPEPERIDITCPQCDSEWTCGDPANLTCPDCEASFSVRVRDEFALVERGGWAVAVSLAPSDWHGVVGDG